jgi:hypothetical protein
MAISEAMVTSGGLENRRAWQALAATQAQQQQDSEVRPCCARIAALLQCPHHHCFLALERLICTLLLNFAEICMMLPNGI